MMDHASTPTAHARPLAVLHVIPSVAIAHGGPSRAIVEMETALAARGVRVTTLTTDDDGPGRRLAPGARPALPSGVERVYAAKRTEFYKVSPEVVSWLARHLERFDVVHIHAVFSFTSVAAARMAWRRRIPYVVRPLGTLTRYGVTARRPLLKRASLRWIDGPVLERAAAVHFTSPQEEAEAGMLGLRLKSVVIPLGIAPPAHRPAHTPATSTSPRVLFLSRLDPKKNVECLLEAMVRLPGRLAAVRLAIAGSGSEAYIDTLQARARSLGVDDRIDWLGHVSGDVKSETMASADMFVLPSYSENFGIAAAEAMIAGLPCILSKGVALADDAARAGAAYAVTPDPDAVAAAIVSLCDDPAARRAMSAAARHHADTHYSSSAMATALLALYASVAQPRVPMETAPS